MTLNYTSLVHEGINTLHPYVAGKSVSEIRNRYGLTTVIKLASNENPLGCSSMVQQAIASMTEHQLAAYPAVDYHPLQQALADQLAVDNSQLIVSNGSDLLFTLLLITFALHQNKHMLTHDKAFATFSIQAQLLGIPVKTSPLTANFEVDIPALAKACTNQTALLFLANPNNPTGLLIAKEKLILLMDSIPDSVIVVLDEAYYEYAYPLTESAGLSLLAQYPNLVITRTFSKAYGLAGLRLGYGICDAGIVALLKKIMLPFTVNQVALEAGLAALGDRDFLFKTRAENEKNKQLLALGLTKLGVQFIPSACNFITVYLGRASATVFQALLEKGIIVRPLQPYFMDEYLRVSVGTTQQVYHFLSQLEIILNQ